MSDYGYEVEIRTRFRDIDAMGHVNNAVYATYIEQARIQFLEEVVGVDVDRAGLVIATMEIDFRRPIDFGDAVTVGIGVSEIGESSMTMEYEVRRDGAVAAEAETVFVHVDRETGQAEPMPAAWRDAVAAHEAH